MKFVKKSRSPWKTLGSREVYRNPWISVREDRVIQPDGRPSIYGVIEPRPYVGVIPFDERHVYLVRQWRYACNENAWEIPTGGRDGKENALKAAKRELAEETGFSAKRWTWFGTLRELSAISTARGDFYLAEHLSAVPQRLEGAESDLVVKKILLSDALAWIDRRRITDGVSVAALLMLDRRLRNQPKKPNRPGRPRR